MKKLLLFSLAIATVLMTSGTMLSAATAYTLNGEGKTPINTVNGDLTATDGLGRKLYTYSQVGGPKQNRYVGVNFYLTNDGSGNASEIDPSETSNTSVIEKYGINAVGFDYGVGIHYWAEPEIGFYNAQDKWALRYELRMLANAGVDFIYIDGTNKIIYNQALTNLLDCIVEMQAQGIPTVRVVYWTETSTDELDTLMGYYQNPKYRNCWFCWDGKPVLMYGNDNDKDNYAGRHKEPYASFFTWRYSWVPYQTDQKSKNYMTWSDSPETVGENKGFYSYSDKTPVECMSAGASGFAEKSEAQGPYTNFGRSATYGANKSWDFFGLRPDTAKGTWLQDRWNDIFSNPKGLPQIVIGARWNEWTAGQFSKEMNQIPSFIEEFNAEFSRDIEPMKGGFTDNYYYELCNNIRKYKGVSAPQAVSGARSINLNGSFSQWNGVTPVFTDFTGDTAHRNAVAVDNSTVYTNNTGRNDITQTRTSYDGGNIYFYVRTANAISKPSDNNWMLLYIDSDNNHNTGWNGYDYLINKDIIDGSKTTISRYQDNVWQEIGTVSYRTAGNELMISIPRSALGYNGSSFTYNFHWNDNPQKLYDISEFFVNGDSAPDRRFNYTVSASCAYNKSQEKVVAARAKKDTFMNAVSGSFGKGVTENVYKLLHDNDKSTYPRLPDFDLLEPDGNKKTNNFDISTTSLLGRARNVGAQFDGYIRISKDDRYTFTLLSDDGSKLLIDDRVIVDNGSATTKASKQGAIPLQAGYHKFRLDYYCGSGQRYLECDISSPSVAKKSVLGDLYVGTAKGSLPTVTSTTGGYFSDANGSAAAAAASSSVSSAVSSTVSGTDSLQGSSSNSLQRTGAKKAGSSALIWVILIIAVIVIGGGGTTFFVLRKKGIIKF